MRVCNGHLDTRAVTRPEAPFVLSGTGNALASAVYGAAPLTMLVKTNVVGVEGEIGAAEGFLTLFELNRQV
jgi:hypothetical protein